MCLRVASRPTRAKWLREVHGVVVPLLERDDREVGALADDDLDVLARRASPVPRSTTWPRLFGAASITVCAARGVDAERRCG